MDTVRVYVQMNNDETKVTKCPGCGHLVDLDSNPYRPFCSKRCKMADLGSWLKEEYRISSSLYFMESNMDQEEEKRH